MSKSFLSAAVVAAFSTGVLLTAGCSGPTRESDWPQTYPVTGTVIMDGKPVVNATVAFNPVAEGAKAARGRTDEQGTYYLKTFFAASFDETGAVAGSHKVTVFTPPPQVKEENTPPPSSPQEQAAQRMREMQQQNTRKARMTMKKSGLPEQYMDVSTTPLTFEVKPTAENVIDIVLVP